MLLIEWRCLMTKQMYARWDRASVMVTGFAVVWALNVEHIRERTGVSDIFVTPVWVAFVQRGGALSFLSHGYYMELFLLGKLFWRVPVSDYPCTDLPSIVHSPLLVSKT